MVSGHLLPGPFDRLDDRFDDRLNDWFGDGPRDRLWTLLDCPVGMAALDSCLDPVLDFRLDFRLDFGAGLRGALQGSERQPDALQTPHPTFHRSFLRSFGEALPEFTPGFSPGFSRDFWGIKAVDLSFQIQDKSRLTLAYCARSDWCGVVVSENPRCSCSPQSPLQPALPIASMRETA